MYLPPILLTSSVIAMDSSVALRNEESRIFHTLESISKWSEISPKSKFVICDGSGFNFSSLVKSQFPSLSIESLYFMNDHELIKKHGKGFGEGEIIQFALAKSQFLYESDWFVKCTAKLWVENYDSCLRQWNSQFVCKAFFDNIFSLEDTHLEYIDTRFYMCNKSFYLKNFLDAYKNLSIDSGLSIEDEFLRILYSLNLKRYIFRDPPVIGGVGGGSGKYYKTSLLRRLKDYVRNQLACRSNKYRDLFI